MPSYFAQVSLQAQSGLGQDEVINTMALDGAGSGTPEDDIELIISALDAFYSELATEEVIGDWLTGNFTVALYIPNLATGVLGAPVAFGSSIFTNGTGNTLPAEVAMCMSFAAAAEIGSVSARRRGRIYIGAIAVATLGATQPPRPIESKITALADAGEDLLTALGAAGVPLHVWSRVNGEVAEVERLWVDDEYDTVRSRGLEPTMRVNRPAP